MPTSLAVYKRGCSLSFLGIVRLQVSNFIESGWSWYPRRVTSIIKETDLYIIERGSGSITYPFFTFFILGYLSSNIHLYLLFAEELGQLVEVRQFFVLLIRTYRPGILDLNYLQDLITTNHRFLTTQEATSQLHPSMPSFDIVNHVKQ